MRIEKYELVFDRSKTSFDFISERPKGRILKTVRFTKIKAKGYNNLYNLASGDKNTDLENGYIYYQFVNHNFLSHNP